jgi:hypothetical protein
MGEVPRGSAPARLLRLLGGHLAALGSPAARQEAGPLGGPPLPRLLQLAAFRGRPFATTFGRPGGFSQREEGRRDEDGGPAADARRRQGGGQGGRAEEGLKRSGLRAGCVLPAAWDKLC